MAIKKVFLLNQTTPVVIPSGLVPKGAYNEATDYAVGDSVDYLGSSYVMFADAAAGTVPTDTTKWQVLADKGDTGAQGETGETGLTGDTGASITSAAFSADDIIFTKDDASTVTLVDAAVTLKGDTGATGGTGTLEDLGGATKALDNLASVAINTSLISDTDSTDDLGSSAKYWRNAYIDKIYSPTIDGKTNGTQLYPNSHKLTIVSEMETGWTQDGGTMSYDTSDYISGSGSMKITCPSDASKGGAIRTFTAEDWSRDTFSIFLKSDDWANITDGYILLSTSGSFASFYRFQFTPSIQRPVDGEWLEYTMGKSDFDYEEGTPDWSTVNGIIFQIFATNGETPSLWVDRIARTRSPKRPTVSICFDDGGETNATIARPILDSLGMRATAFIMPSYIGQATYLTEAQVNYLASGGWDIAGHGFNDLTTLTLAAAEADVASAKAWLTSRGYKGSHLYSYPLGGQNDDIRAFMRKYFSVTRGTSKTGMSTSYVPIQNLTTRQAGQAISTATIQGWIDAAVANNEWLIITFHRLIATPVTDEDYTPANFTTVMTYLAAQDCDVQPISEVIARSGLNLPDDTVADVTDLASYLPLAGGTMTGNIQLGETGIRLDAVLSGDETFSGITELGTMGYSATVGDLVYLAVADTKWELAKADAAATSVGKIGLVTATTAENSACQVLLYGKMRSAAFPAAFTVGAPVYISAATAGDVVVAAPTGTTGFVVRSIGYGNTAEDLFFCPDNNYLELA